MTRRNFLAVAGLAQGATSTGGLDVPVCLIQDGRAKFEKDRLAAFWREIWAQALRDLGRCGIRLDVKRAAGEVKRLPSNRPSLTGLERGRLNVVVTNQLPLAWDNGRGLNGVTTLYQGFHLCMFAVHFAHGHQVPLLSVNTCVHELLHALCGDIFENRPEGAAGAWRELRIDALATRLWLFGDGVGVRLMAERYVRRLRGSA